MTTREACLQSGHQPPASAPWDDELFKDEDVEVGDGRWSAY
ncbi:MAG: hypothetical protein ABIP13_06780 [Tepidiformaceae bacterium]